MPYASAPRWIPFNPLAPAELPAHAACYVIFSDGRPVYVGQTSNLKQRFYSHAIRVRDGGITSKSWGELRGPISMKAKMAQRLGDWAMREVRLIYRLCPPLNRRVF